jgi:hypothetical protein
MADPEDRRLIVSISSIAHTGSWEAMIVYVGIVESTALVRTKRLILGMSGPVQFGSLAATLSISGLKQALGMALVDIGTPK